MTLSEALRSNKPIRKAGWPPGVFVEVRVDKLFWGNGKIFKVYVHNIIADDWEIIS